MFYYPYGIRTVEATGETDYISPLIRGRYDIPPPHVREVRRRSCSLTHISCRQAVCHRYRRSTDDRQRQLAGANLEFLLTLIRMQRRQGIEPQTIALSAVIGDTNGLEEWLGGRLLRA